MEWHVRKQDERYLVEDLDLGEIMVSRTVLQPGKSTTGHSHANDEVYVFLNNCSFQVGNIFFDMKAGRGYTVRGDAFHRVFNEGKVPIEFICTWAK